MKKILFIIIVFVGVATNGFCAYHFTKATKGSIESGYETVEIDDSGAFTMQGYAFSNASGGFAQFYAQLKYNSEVVQSISLFARETSVSETATYTGDVDDLIYRYVLVCKGTGYSVFELYLYW